MFVGVVSILLLPLFSSFINRQSSRIYSGRLLLFEGLVSYKNLDGLSMPKSRPITLPNLNSFIFGFWKLTWRNKIG